MDKFEEFYKQNCLDHFGYDPDLNWIFEKHEDGSYIQIEVENAKKVYQHQQAKVEELEKQFDQHDKLLLQRNKDVQELYDINAKHVAEKAELQKRVDAALAVLTEYYTGSYDESPDLVVDIEQALKGEGQ
ncbi:TPA: hypothetical protein JI077_03040 [Acinetobacter baumannii]|nr:hypothetical protein [Acinetobacter baumannii]